MQPMQQLKQYLKYYLDTGLEVEFRGYPNKEVMEEALNDHSLSFEEKEKKYHVDKIGKIRSITMRKDYTVYHVGKAAYYTKSLFIGDFKPLMRPLSDLTKEIVVDNYNDGKPFVPMVKLFEKAVGINYFDEDPYDIFDIREPRKGYYLIYELNRGIGVTIDLEDDCNFRVFDDDSSLREIKYQLGLFKMLFSWHFWLFDQSYFEKGIIKAI